MKCYGKKIYLEIFHSLLKTKFFWQCDKKYRLNLSSFLFCIVLCIHSQDLYNYEVKVML